MNFSIVLILATIGVYANAAPKTCTEREILPHEYDCTKYYMCLKGELVEFECKKGFWWNQQLKYCDLPESSGCVPGPTPTPTESTETPEPTSENPTTENTESTTTPEPTTEYPTTPEPTTEYPTTPEPTTEYPTTLEPTTEYPTTPEPTTEYPTTPEPTTEFPTTPEPTTEYPTTPEPTTEYPTTPEPTTEYPTTPEPTTEYPTTPEPTTEYPTTESTESTTPEPTSETPTESTTPGETDAEIIARVCDPTKVSLERYPRSCDKYVYCAQENSAVKKCSEGKEFSATLKICLPAEDADCSEDDETTTTEEPTTETPTTTPEPETTTPEPTTTTTRTTTPSEQEIIDAACDPVAVSFEPYPGSCVKYIFCGGLISYVRECTDDKEFSPIQKMCLPKDQANCSV